ncbi:hypothetical protein Q5424_23150 [Conexibacter sp. JD483]|uniref:hypothetical protein n=1 Tax=unclassified Conexibacter TaxID=2627773 RepID=UPI0027204690|nr:MULTISPECIES: hypothetical protein [unclassified Conexibacter]MDO8186060.1 hypothetical protein [Conexibacter sp. CPCC 205706]MDO8199550.1 hypothetical protein [Conexibacter sp. CPCC 205762]MDR9372014.1 hypothetical protein [Conexibacter sp. JD483]
MTASMAGAVEGVQNGWLSNSAGSAPDPTVTRVAVDDLASTLEQQSQQAVDSFGRVGNAILSDPAKLAAVGANADCIPRGSGSRGCAPGLEQFDTSDADEAANAASLSVERVLYEQIVPLSYPVWNTGMTRSADPAADFGCNDVHIAEHSPFTGAPRGSWSFTLEQVATTGEPDPLPRMDTKRWRVWSMLGQTADGTYLRPADALLLRMFGAADPDDRLAPLGLLPQRLMSESTSRFPVPSDYDCRWTIPGTGIPEP